MGLPYKYYEVLRSPEKGVQSVRNWATNRLGNFLALFQFPNRGYDDKSEYQKDRSYWEVTRGFLGLVDDVESGIFDRVYQFQFNPATISTNKQTNYSNRPYPGLPYEELIWSGAGPREISFELFIDDTPQSRGFEAKSGLYYNNEAEGYYSKTRNNARGVLPACETLESFLYPKQSAEGVKVPQFYSGGVVADRQFIPPGLVYFSFGPMRFKGIVVSCNIELMLFDKDLTPIRAKAQVTFSALEYSVLESIPVLGRGNLRSSDGLNGRLW